MPNRGLPLEILDHIVDFLHDNREPLSQCCLVSKSWIPRVRKHIFAVVKFRTLDDIDTWKKTFPDPSNSPAQYTRTLSITCFEVVTAVDIAEGGWIPTFSRVVSLDLHVGLKPIAVPMRISFAPFYKLSPTLKSLNVTSFLLPLSQVLNLVHSLSLLEDLALVGTGTVIDDNECDGPPAVVSSSIQPKLTGTLDIFLFGGVAVALRPLLHPPNGVHLRAIKLSWCKDVEDLRCLVELVVACSGTLESLYVAYKPEGVVCFVYFWPSHLLGVWPAGEPTLNAIDLSTATKLKNVEFRCETFECGWLIMTLETIAPKHRDFQQVTIHIPSFVSYVSAESLTMAEEEWIENASPGVRWSDLDRVLIKLWESHMTRVKVIYPEPWISHVGREMKDWAVYLLPESTKRGITDLVQEPGESDYLAPFIDTFKG